MTVAEDRMAQGLPPTVEDPLALMRIAHLIAGPPKPQAPAKALRQPAKDFVYFIRSEAGFIKIGRSEQPQARLKSLAANVPGLVLLATVPDGNREKEFHRRFAPHRAHGEWFHPAPPLLAFLEELKWAAAEKGSAK